MGSGTSGYGSSRSPRAAMAASFRPTSARVIAVNAHGKVGLAAAWVALLSLALAAPPPTAADAKGDEVVHRMPQLLSPEHRDDVLKLVRKRWQPEFVPMILDLIPLSRDGSWNRELIGLLEEKTGEKLGYDVEQWYAWLWAREPRLHPLYPELKAAVYGLLDPKFRGYFSKDRTTLVRLDEVRWGGVRQDGIPPLRSPPTIPAAEAAYLGEGDVVFGIAVNGDARAYPKRILAWHEMFTDEVGGEPVTGVYCTLCGTMILYQSGGHRFGTSGFLYRSNKLMYDQATQSLWNTIWGRPVIGPLADQEITLERLSVVTTTWGEWRRRHPESRVVSLDTGFRRDYSEGTAYREYFATDELMFGVGPRDRRLANKAEVLGLVFARHPDQPLAISARFLEENPLHHDRVGEVRFVVLTDASGANRVYETGDVVVSEWDGDATAIDDLGMRWTLTEDELRAADGRTLPRLPSHRAFWFGWYAAYTHTRLVD